jgi:4-hydroxy-tetrahydrodipicolinate reductase
MLRVGVIGAAGRMGATVCRHVEADPELALVAAVDPSAAGRPLADVAGTVPVPDGGGLVVGPSLEALVAAQTDVAVDFTRAAVAREALGWCAAHGISAVSGTSGLSPEDLDGLRRAFGSAARDGSPAEAHPPGDSGSPDGRPPGCVWVPNFAIGAVLMMRLAEIAAPYLDSVEVIELHHDQKQDAPSGTAVETARLLARARAGAGRPPWPADPTREAVIEGARGASGEGGVRIHSVRLPGLVAHQEILFGAAGQTLSIRHDSYDRSSFMPGVLLAVKAVCDRPGLTVGLAPILGL